MSGGFPSRLRPPPEKRQIAEIPVLRDRRKAVLYFSLCPRIDAFEGAVLEMRDGPRPERGREVWLSQNVVRLVFESTSAFALVKSA